ncbi:MAG: methyltransferase domain-containing protein [Candidatus Doudnabacteria bacterium]|nr:methyltransferase domain-containing protein [Candidatus Doudnabacteria bacterium]
MKQSTSWGKVAGWYNQLLQEGEDTYQEKIIKPNLLRILAPKSGEEILDVGCGQGFFAREIGKAGAKVLGIDVGGELIRLAKAQAGKNETYLVLSAEKMAGLADSRFNAAVCVLALQNIKNMQAAILEISRVLKPGGRAVLVLNHPAFRIPGASTWGYDEKTNIQYRNINKYLSQISQEVDMTQGVADPKRKKFTLSFHHPLQVYFKAFAKAGLAVSRLEEWVSHKTSDKGPRKQAEDAARKEIPLFMCLELKKIY